MRCVVSVFTTISVYMIQDEFSVKNFSFKLAVTLHITKGCLSSNFQRIEGKGLGKLLGLKFVGHVQA